MAKTSKYRVKISPSFELDIFEVVDYISHTLNNPSAAEKIVSDIQTAIEERSFCAESFEPYISKKKRKNVYYRIYVGSYTIYYVVIDDVMEVRRLLYSRRNIAKQI